jgi:hypothetical protein
MTAPQIDPFDLHETRRRNGLPSLAMVAGPIGLGLRRVREWSSRNDRPVAVVHDISPHRLARAWCKALSDSHDFRRDLLAWLARISGLDVDELRSRLAGYTRRDFEMFWTCLPVDSHADIAHQLSAALLESAGDSIDVALQGMMNAEEDSTSTTRVLEFLARLATDGRLPVVACVPPPGDAATVAWLESAGRAAARVVEAVPAFHAAIFVPRHLADAFIAADPDSRLATMLREGRVDVDGLGEADLRQRLGPLADAVPTSTFRALVELGATEAMANRLTETVQAHATPPSDPAAEDAARSSAERLLFELLESQPETAGKFALNAPLEFLHGPSAAEADLVAAEFRLVIELDGGYYHLANRKAYRRDRRKDWEYQRHGYLVLRFLSEDVVPDQENVMATILAAVALRRPLSNSNRGNTS